jgi:hypothetical protein
MDLGQLAAVLSQLGAFGVAVFVLFAMLTERLVPRGRLDELRKRLDDCESELSIRRQRPP